MQPKSVFLSLVIITLLLASCSQAQPLHQVPPTLLPTTPPPQVSVFQITPAFTATPSQIVPTDTPPVSSPTPPPAITSGLPLTLLSLQMIDLQSGWGEAQLPDSSEQALVNTADGGLTWTTANLPGGYPAYSKYFTLDGRTIWAVGSQLDSALVDANGITVYRSDNRGQDWHGSQPIFPQTSEQALAETFIPNVIYFLDGSTGWIAASIGHYMNQDVIVLYQTLDGGQNWSLITDKFQAGQDGSAGLPCQVLGMVFVDAQHGWLAGNCLAVSLDERWKVLETADGGHTWQYRDLPQPTDAPANVLSNQAACGPDGIHRQAAGLLTLDFRCIDYSSPGSTPVFIFTYTSSDSGATWNTAQLTSASFANADFGIGLGPLSTSGQRSLFTTKDSGRTWTASYPVTWPEAWLTFVDAQNGWAVARRFNNDTGQYDYALVRTRDGGGRWELVQPTAR